MIEKKDATECFGSSDCSSCRGQFETWISSDPYSESVARYPNDPTKYGWPGSYKDIRVDMCWMAWREAWRLGDKCRDGCKIRRAVKEFSENLTPDY